MVIKELTKLRLKVRQTREITQPPQPICAFNFGNMLDSGHINAR